jgi:hypothetical protein
MKCPSSLSFIILYSIVPYLISRFIAITKFLSMINLSFDFRVGGICLFMTVVMYILFYMYCLLYLIGGVPRMGPRVPFALLPFGHYPIKYLKLKLKEV